jgi:hypothetical protein
MQKLPVEIRKIVVQLHELRASYSIFGQQERERMIVALLNKLVVENAPGTLPCIAKFLVSPNQNVRQEAVRCLSRITDGSELPFLIIRQLSENCCNGLKRPNAIEYSLALQIRTKKTSLTAWTNRLERFQAKRSC